MMPRFAIIVAMDRNGLIGNGNRLPWHIPEDLAYFKRITLGHSIVMGRNTYESIGRALPFRKNYVLSTHQRDYDEVLSVDSIPKLTSFLAEDELVFVIGGREIFKQFLDVADFLYLTRIDAVFEGNIHFPEIDWKRWTLVSTEQVDTGSIQLVFEIYRRS
jgi:dihydrofolate reductase